MRRILSGSVASPAAGAEWSNVFSTNEPFRLISIQAKLTASAVVANRQVAFLLRDVNGLECYFSGSTSNIAASGSGHAQASIAQATSQATNDGQGNGLVTPWPDFWLPPGWSIASRTASLDVGDQWSAINYVGEFGLDAWHRDQRDAAIEALYEAYAAHASQ